MLLRTFAIADNIKINLCKVLMMTMMMMMATTSNDKIGKGINKWIRKLTEWWKWQIYKFSLESRLSTYGFGIVKSWCTLLRLMAVMSSVSQMIDTSPLSVCFQHRDCICKMYIVHPYHNPYTSMLPIYLLFLSSLTVYFIFPFFPTDGMNDLNKVVRCTLYILHTAFYIVLPCSYVHVHADKSYVLVYLFVFVFCIPWIFVSFLSQASVTQLNL